MAKKKKVIYRKFHKFDYEGHPKGEFKTSLIDGDYGLQVVCGKGKKKVGVGSWCTRQQVKAALLVIKRMIKNNKNASYRSRFPRFWPKTQKPAEVRMGSGKGSPTSEIVVVVPGEVIFELKGVTEENAREIFTLAQQKLPVVTRFLKELTKHKAEVEKVKKIDV